MKLEIGSIFKKYWILLTLVAVKMGLQLMVVNPVYELHRDEFLHLDLANHLSSDCPQSGLHGRSWKPVVLYTGVS